MLDGRRWLLPLFLAGWFFSAGAADPTFGAGKRGKAFSPDTPTGDMPYLIVTTAAMASAFVPLADWKTKTGLPAHVVTVEAILAAPTLSGNDPAEKIRAFIRDAHENWNTRWVLLGGHVTEVPSRGTHLRRGEHGGCGNLSDLYFGDILPGKTPAEQDVEIYNWNGDGDSRFGESGDGMDLAAELYVARLPFRTPEQVGDYLKKYFSYAGGQKGDFRGRALVVGAEEFRGRQEALTKLLSGLRKDSDYQVDSLIEVPVPKIIETMNKGYAVLDIFGHGCPHHMWLG
ncbi:MAG: C25 family cysteine peptidase, partial [Planctomycetota bacterium]